MNVHPSQKKKKKKKLSSWLSDYGFQGLIANGTFSVSNAMTTLRDKWFNPVCQSDFTKVKCFMDIMFLIQIKWLNTYQPDLLQPCLLSSSLD